MVTRSRDISPIDLSPDFVQNDEYPDIGLKANIARPDMRDCGVE
jgi:hypothetical protein